MEKNGKTKFSIKNVDLFYDDFQALKDISFDIQEKHITALIGPSGCGKSTFLRLLNRLNDRIKGVTISGSVEYDGIDIYIYYDVIELRRRVGMVFQKPNPFPMSIFDNIAHGPRVHGIRKRTQLEEIIEKSLRQAALWEEVRDRLHTPAFGLSGGQQQRLCIARVLSVEPDVVLLDEPTSALDPISTARIEDLVIKLKEDYTIVIVTHNLQQAARLADKTAFFLSGELIEYGDTTDIFINPKQSKTESYILGQFG